ncbi:unnamed protein product [marine sediment metagenome]|uniref:Uncharacterized protein n=1 Tax=marine sediment metagenome TaxID=412755 RepID=X0UPT5_9ZZZZ
MRIQFQIMMFAIFFNIALFFIASTGFFIAENTFYGDAFTYDVDDPEFDINDPDKLPSPNDVLERLYQNTVTLEIARIPLTEIDLTYEALMWSIVAIGIAIAIVTHSLVPVGLMLVGMMFSLMWANSQDIIYKLTSGLDTSINYIILIFLIGMMISFCILIYDTASGQRSTK